MAGKILLAILLACVASVAGFFYIPIQTNNNFRHLSVTLPDPLRPLELGYWFNDIPLTQGSAALRGWSLVPGSTCSNGGKYSGVRYFPPTAKSIAALYDNRGVIAGFQALFKVESMVKGSNELDCLTYGKYINNYQFDGEPMINREVINGIEYFVLTAYFVPPSQICASTRNPLLVSFQGFGNQILFQNGPTPATLISAPATRPQAAAQSWTNNRCLPLNGYHNFYKSEEWDSKHCSDNRPSWLFYDENQKLSGFGFSMPGCDGSPRFQHPPGLIVEYVAGSKCAKRVADTIKWSNINVYLTPPSSTINDCLPDVFNFISSVRNFLRQRFGLRV